MADLRYAWGNNLSAFFRTSTGCVEVTTAGTFDSTMGLTGSILVPYGEYILTMPFVDAISATTLWLHFEFYTTGISSAGSPHPDIIGAFNSSGVEVFRIITSGVITQNVSFEYWNGSAFVSFAVVTGLYVPSATTRYRMDMKIVCGATGSLEIYQGGTLIYSSIVSGVTSMNAAFNNIAQFRFGNSWNGANAYYSQVMVANFDTRDSRLSPQLAAALGTYTSGAGAASDINEAVLDETTSASLAASGDKRSFTHATYTLPAGYQIGAVCLSGRGRINGTGPSDGSFGLLNVTPNTDAIFSPSLGFNTGFEPRGRYAKQDPATASDWTQAGYNDKQFILKAA